MVDGTPPVGPARAATRSCSTAASGIAEADAPATWRRSQPTKIIAVHLTYRSRVDEYAARDAAGAVVLHEAADDAERAPRPMPTAARRALPQLRGRARRRHRPADEGRARGRGARLRRRATPAPTTSACTTSATPTAARCCASRARTASCRSARSSCPQPSSTPTELHAPHLPERRGRPGGDGGRPALRRRLPARRPLPADHAGAGRRDPDRHAGQLAADGAGRRRRGRDLRASAASRTPSIDWDVDLSGPGEQMAGLGRTRCTSRWRSPEDEAERLVAEGVEP